MLAAGGAGLAVIGLFLTTSTRVPIGTVASFGSLTAVSNFFGATSNEATTAGIYFQGFEGATQTPGAALYAQYPTASVAAYARGGNISALPLATLQGYSGTLSITIDGSLKTASVNLSAATSFSNAAEIIAADLAIEGVAVGTVTGSIGGTSSTSTTTGTVLTLGALATGKLQVGDTVTANDGTNALNTTILAQLTGTPGGSAGATYTLAAAASPGDLTSTTVTAKGKTLTVTALGTAAAVSAGDVLSGTGITANTYVAAQVTPLIGGEAAGGVGRYTISTQPAGVVVSETITLFNPAVQYDSVSGAFVILSGTTGAASTITYGSGAMATDLLLTQATGAVLSQGAIAGVPASFMNALIQVNNNWVGFTTLFDPDAGSGNTQKQAFAAWKNTQNNRFAYVCDDTDASPTTTLPATSSLGYILANNGDSGTSLNYEPSALHLSSFVLGAMASINFNQKNGRITFAGKSGNVVAGVTDPTTAQNLAGNPQVPGSFGNGYNFYGAYATAGQGNIWYQRGSVTGPFLWFDSYINQIWFLNQCQIALLTTIGNVNSIPFNATGQALVEQVLQPAIQSGLNFGMFGPGPIDAGTSAQINQKAGANIAATISAQGWYLQYVPASSAVKASRGPQQLIFWYLDNGSVQSINLSSVAVIGG